MIHRSSVAKRFCRRGIAPALAGILGVAAAGWVHAAPLSLDECVDIARKQNPGVAAARYGVEAARGSRLSSSSAFLPSVTTSGGFRQTSSRPGSPVVDVVLSDSAGITYDITYDRVNDGYSSSYAITQNLVDFPAFYEYRASGFDLLSARHSLRASEAQLIYQVRQQYFALLKAILLKQVATEALGVADAQLRKSEALFDLGSVARADVLQARVNRAAKERAEIASRTAIEQERARLGTLLGLDVQEPLEIRLDVADPPPAELDEAALMGEATDGLP